jgi:hypothetical protein
MSPTIESILADEMEHLASRLGALVSELEPDRLEPATALRVLGAFARAAKHAAAGEALVARRVDDTGAHEHAGFASTEQLLASVAGTSPAHAAKVVETGRRLAVHEQTAAAVRGGHVSVEQAHAVTTAAAAAPDAEASLLDLAARKGLRHLEARARDVRLAADDDRLGRYHRQRATRRLHHGIDDDGMGWGRWHLPPDQHMAVVNRLERQADREYRRAYREGRREDHDRSLADALVALTTARAHVDDGNGAASRDLRADVVVHVSLEALRRGRVEEGGHELCTVQGGGPVAVERVHELIEGDAFLKGVLVDGTDVAKVRHFGRNRPAEVDTALEVRAVRANGDVVCSVEGCDRRLGLEWDHVEPFAARGPTSVDNLQPLCRIHHRQKTARNRNRRGSKRSPARSGPAP